MTTTARDWLAVPLFLSAALAGCAPGATPDQLPPIPDIDVSGYIDATSSQLNQLRGAVERDPLDAGANGQLGKAYRAYRIFAAAEAAFQRARLLAPRSIDWAYYHGETLEELAEYDRAMEAMQVVLATESDNAAAKIRLARMLGKVGRVEEARAVLRSLVVDKPLHAPAHVALAVLEERAGNPQVAIAAWDEAIAIAGDFGQAHYALSLLYQRLGMIDEAQEHRLRFELFQARPGPVDDPRMAELMRSGRSDKLLLRAARIVKAAGNDVKALEILEEAIVLNPNNLEARAALVAGYAANRMFDKADANFAAGQKIRAAHAGLNLSMARMRISQGRLPEAIDILEDVVAGSPDEASAWAWLGYAQLALGQSDIAGESLQKAVSADVRNPDARRFYGRWLNAYAEPEFAISELSMLLRVTAVDNPQLLGRLAALQADAGDRRAALTSLARGIEIAGYLRNVEAQRQLRKLQRDIESEQKTTMAP